jgi:hypothetical protein
MKWMKGVIVVAGMLALMIAGCGGGGTTDTSTDTPAATSAKSASAAATFINVGGAITGLVLQDFGQQGAGMVTKAAQDGVMVDCDWASLEATWQLDCVVWDSQGSATSSDHMCNMTGNLDTQNLRFDLTYDCYNFSPTGDLTIDGNYTAVITVSPDFGTQTVNSCSCKGVDATKQDSECTIEDNVTEFECDGMTCSWDTNTTPLCAAANADVVAVVTVGSRGVTVTDPCGTYTYSTGTTMNSQICTPTDTNVTFTFILDGVFNGQDVNITYNVDCDLTG